LESRYANKRYMHTHTSTYPEFGNPWHMNPCLTHTFVLNTTGQTYWTVRHTMLLKHLYLILAIHTTAAGRLWTVRHTMLLKHLYLILAIHTTAAGRLCNVLPQKYLQWRHAYPKLYVIIRCKWRDTMTFNVYNAKHKSYDRQPTGDTARSSSDSRITSASRYGGNQSPNQVWCQASRIAYDLVLV